MSIVLETAEERSLWVQAHAAAAAQAQGPLYRLQAIADAAIEAYRERCSSSEVERLTEERDAARRLVCRLLAAAAAQHALGPTEFAADLNWGYLYEESSE